MENEMDEARNRAVDDAYNSREHQWDDAWPSGGDGPGDHPADELDLEDEVMPFPEVSGTHDAEEAVRDAEPYVPPTDPPVLPGGYEGVHVATGFGLSPEEEAADGGEPRGDYDLQELALVTLQQDSLTSHYELVPRVRNGVIHLTGRVPSFDDAEHAMSILDELPGVVEVVDDTTLDPTLAE
jgi:hypothetical protein